jgi:glycosyltransferase involved in cell wall biosynthesis
MITKRIWLMNIGEPLPMVLADERRLRMGLLAETLAARGHDVTWWASTFDHNSKTQIVSNERRVPVHDGLALELLASMPYPRNVSLSRFINHWQVARRFTIRARVAPKPDVLLCTIPTVELAAAAVVFGRRLGVPVIVDVRDLWPDILVDLVPGPARALGRLVLDPLFRAARNALRGADAITAVSRTYLDWGVRRAGRAVSPRDRVFPLGYPRPSADAGALAVAGRSLAARGVDAGKRIVWFVGMFGRTYDLSTVIAAARSLQAREMDDVQFVLSGAGDHDARWRSEAAGLTNVVFTGWVAAVEIEYLLSVAWVGLAAYAPGAPQSLPNKIFEYMSGGVPLLSSLRGEAEVLLEASGAGASYKAGDSEDLASKLAGLHGDPASMAAMRDSSRRLYEREYAADIVYERMADYIAAGAPPQGGTPDAR